MHQSYWILFSYSRLCKVHIHIIVIARAKCNMQYHVFQKTPEKNTITSIDHDFGNIYFETNIDIMNT